MKQNRIWLASVALVAAAGATGLVGAQQGNAPAQAAAGRMLRPKLLIHVVADLEKSIAFYREGMNLAGRAGRPR